MAKDGALPTTAVILIESCPDIGYAPAWGDAEIHIGHIHRWKEGLAFDCAYTIGRDEPHEAEHPYTLRRLPHEYAETKSIISYSGAGSVAFELMDRVSFGRKWWLFSRGEILTVHLTSPTKTPFLIVTGIDELKHLSNPKLYSAVEYRYVRAQSASDWDQQVTRNVSRCLEPLYGYGHVELTI